jgi:hypothetical protein
MTEKATLPTEEESAPSEAATETSTIKFPIVDSPSSVDELVNNIVHHPVWQFLPMVNRTQDREVGIQRQTAERAAQNLLILRDCLSYIEMCVRRMYNSPGSLVYRQMVVNLFPFYTIRRLINHEAIALSEHASIPYQTLWSVFKQVLEHDRILAYWLAVPDMREGMSDQGYAPLNAYNNRLLDGPVESLHTIRSHGVRLPKTSKIYKIITGGVGEDYSRDDVLGNPAWKEAEETEAKAKAEEEKKDVMVEIVMPISVRAYASERTSGTAIADVPMNVPKSVLDKCLTTNDNGPMIEWLAGETEAGRINSEDLESKLQGLTGYEADDCFDIDDMEPEEDWARNVQDDGIYPPTYALIQNIKRAVPPA